MEGYLIYENGVPRESQVSYHRCHQVFLERQQAEEICRNLSGKYRKSRFEVVRVVLTPQK